jgi:2-oxoacid:acceptor oxidoreductase delta subunit (pyruvate/2-ketoisovalerate family)
MAKLDDWTEPKTWLEVPVWPHMASGHIVEGHAAWRERRPKLTLARCRHCLNCYLFCPDAAIAPTQGGVSVDLDLCKGCGICAAECRHGAIDMEDDR